MSHTAHCSCGQLKIHCLGDPLRVGLCHCLSCQRRTGSVFGNLFLIFEKINLNLGVQARYGSDQVQMEGESKQYTRVGISLSFPFFLSFLDLFYYLGDSGGEIIFSFCGTCGATVWWKILSIPECVIIPIGMKIINSLSVIFFS